MLITCSVFCSETPDKVFHKTVAQVEAYKNKGTLNFKAGCVKRLTRNLLTPIHKRHRKQLKNTDKHINKKSCEGPLTVKFLLPLSLKNEILSLLAKDALTLTIPLAEAIVVHASNIEIDRYSKTPNGLFGMRCLIESDQLSPSQIVFIHLLKGDI